MARGKGKKLKMSGGAMKARVKFEEAKHKRDISGKFADMPGSGSAAGGTAGAASAAPATKADWQAAAKTSAVGSDDVIKLQVTSNPKKPGSAAAERFAKYQDGQTVGDFLKAGGTREDLAWDRKKGFVTFHDKETYTKLSTGTASPVAEISSTGASGHLQAIKLEHELAATPVKTPTPDVPLGGTGEPPTPKAVQPPAGAPGEPGAPTPQPKAPGSPSPMPAEPAPSLAAGAKVPPPTDAELAARPTPPAAVMTPNPDAPPLVVKPPEKKPDTYQWKADELSPLSADKMADESDAGLKWEYEKEYIQYGGKGWAPGITSQEDFNKRYKAAGLKYLTDQEYDNLGYTSINTKSLRTFSQIAPGLKARNRNPEAIRERMYTGITTPPIVLKRKGQDGLRLMAGQSRMWVGLASGFRVPVKVIEV